MDYKKINKQRLKRPAILLIVILGLAIAYIWYAKNTSYYERKDTSMVCHGSRPISAADVARYQERIAADNAGLPQESENGTGKENDPSIENAKLRGDYAIEPDSVQAYASPSGMTTDKTGEISASTQTVSTKKMVLAIGNGFGIAAGGDLVYWSQTDLDSYFQGVKDIGATWVRWDIDWQVVQPYGFTTYNWDGTDRVADTAEKYGIHSLGLITYAPNWATGKICPSGKQCPPENPEMFANFAGETAKRYKGKINAFEIWNEPNYEVYWYPKPDAVDYSKLLSASYSKIKDNNPDAIVLSAGLTDMGDEDGVSISPANFIKAMYENGAKDSIDIIALHPYTYPGYSYGWQQVISIHEYLRAQGDDGKIWITEYGAPTGGPGKAYDIGERGFYYGKDFMTETAQDEMAKDIFAFQQENSGWMENIFWYSLCDAGTDQSSTENFFGLLQKDGTPKLAYDTLKKLFSK